MASAMVAASAGQSGNWWRDASSPGRAAVDAVSKDRTELVSEVLDAIKDTGASSIGVAEGLSGWR